MKKYIKFRKRLGWMLLIAILLVTMLPMEGLGNIFAISEKNPLKVQAAVALNNPIIEEDDSMESGQKVTWDCVWFGSYPQTEIVLKGSKEEASLKEMNFYYETKYESISDDEYREIVNASYNENGDAEINGEKYRRLRAVDVEYYADDKENFREYYYNWDNDFETWHYFKYEPIKWRVLQINNKSLFLLADMALDDQKYNMEEGAVTWETSTIRSWLNGYDGINNQNNIDYRKENFIDTAFSDEQQELIQMTHLINDDTVEVEGGNDTEDKIFLMSIKEMSDDKSMSYGFINTTGWNDEARRSKTSTYAFARGVNRDYYRGNDRNDNEDYCDGNCWWWLRSPGWESDRIADVEEGGWVGTDGSWSINSTNGVRPALYVNIPESDFYSYAGTVCSDGSINEQEFEIQDDYMTVKSGKFTVLDMYGFKNWNASISKKYYEKFFGKAQAKKLYEKNEDKEHGVCSGIVCTAMATLCKDSPEVESYGVNSLYKITDLNTKSVITGKSVKDYIFYGHMAQYFPYVQTQRDRNGGNLSALYNAVIAYAEGKTEQPVYISVQQDDNSHALWGLGVIDATYSEVLIDVYDCNYPGTTCILKLKKSNGEFIGWEYETKNGYTYSGADKKYYEEGDALISFNTVSPEYFILMYSKEVNYETDDYSNLITIDLNDCEFSTYEEYEEYVNNFNKEVSANGNLIPIISDDETDITDSYQIAFWYNGSVLDKIKFNDVLKNAEINITSPTYSVSASVSEKADITLGISETKENSIKVDFVSGKGKYKITYYDANQKSNDVEMTYITGDGSDSINVIRDNNLINISGVYNVHVSKEYGQENDEAVLTNVKRIDKEQNDLNTSNVYEVNTLSDSLTITKIDDVPNESNNETKFNSNNNLTNVLKVSRINVSGISNKIAAGKKIKLSTNICPINATDKRIIWSSSNPKVAKVNQNGIVTIKKKSGGKSVRIIAKAADGSGTQAVFRIKSMKGVVKKVAISDVKKKTVKAGKRIKLKAKVIATKGANKKLRWISSNPKYATVTSSGKVKTKKAGKGKKVKITAMAMDGSNKKSVVTIKIK